MTHEEKNDLYELLDARYITRTECEPQMNELRNKHAGFDKEIAVLKFQMKVNNWLTATIAAGIIALVIKTFLGG